MKTLEQTYRKNNLFLKLVKRTGNVAMYSVHLDEDTPVCGYEVIKVTVDPEGAVFGKLYPEREHYPGNEQFGTLGFSWATLEQADKKFDELRKMEVVDPIDKLI